MSSPEGKGLQGRVKNIKESFRIRFLGAGRLREEAGSRKSTDEEEHEVDIQLRNRVIRGPKGLRTGHWRQQLAAARKEHLIDRYPEYLAKGPPRDAQNDIEKDVKRTFPGTSRFRSTEGQTQLRNILLAYAAYDAEVAYCQGMNFLTGVLLMYFSDEAHAFAALVLLMEERGLRNFYTRSLALLQVQLWQLSLLISTRLKTHLEACGVVPMLYASSWFMTAFSTEFPLPFAARVMDALLSGHCECVLLKVAVQAMRDREETLLAMVDLEDIVKHLRVGLPALPESDLHKLLDRAFSEPWTKAQLSILRRTEGVETVAQAMERVMASRDEVEADEEMEAEDQEEGAAETASTPTLVPRLDPPPSYRPSPACGTPATGTGSPSGGSFSRGHVAGSNTGLRFLRASEPSVRTSWPVPASNDDTGCGFAHHSFRQSQTSCPGGSQHSPLSNVTGPSAANEGDGRWTASDLRGGRRLGRADSAHCGWYGGDGTSPVMPHRASLAGGRSIRRMSEQHPPGTWQGPQPCAAEYSPPPPSANAMSRRSTDAGLRESGGKPPRAPRWSSAEGPSPVALPHRAFSPSRTAYSHRSRSPSPPYSPVRVSAVASRRILSDQQQPGGTDEDQRLSSSVVGYVPLWEAADLLGSAGPTTLPDAPTDSITSPLQSSCLVEDIAVDMLRALAPTGASSSAKQACHMGSAEAHHDVLSMPEAVALHRPSSGSSFMAPEPAVSFRDAVDEATRQDITTRDTRALSQELTPAGVSAAIAVIPVIPMADALGVIEFHAHGASPSTTAACTSAAEDTAEGCLAKNNTICKQAESDWASVAVSQNAPEMEAMKAEVASAESSSAVPTVAAGQRDEPEAVILKRPVLPCIGGIPIFDPRTLLSDDTEPQGMLTPTIPLGEASFPSLTSSAAVNSSMPTPTLSASMDVAVEEPICAPGLQPADELPLTSCLMNPLAAHIEASYRICVEHQKQQELMADGLSQDQPDAASEAQPESGAAEQGVPTASTSQCADAQEAQPAALLSSLDAPPAAPLAAEEAPMPSLSLLSCIATESGSAAYGPAAAMGSEPQQAVVDALPSSPGGSTVYTAWTGSGASQGDGLVLVSVSCRSLANICVAATAPGALDPEAALGPVPPLLLPPPPPQLPLRIATSDGEVPSPAPLSPAPADCSCCSGPCLAQVGNDVATVDGPGSPGLCTPVSAPGPAWTAVFDGVDNSLASTAAPTLGFVAKQV